MTCFSMTSMERNRGRSALGVLVETGQSFRLHMLRLPGGVEREVVGASELRGRLAFTLLPCKTLQSDFRERRHQAHG
jgi:hypothetical protein